MSAGTHLWRRRAFQRLSPIQDFVRVLMKPRNGQAWTAEDRRFLREGFGALARWTPLFALFLLPGGFALLAGYAWFLDRRRRRRAEGNGAEGRPLT